VHRVVCSLSRHCVSFATVLYHTVTVHPLSRYCIVTIRLLLSQDERMKCIDSVNRNNSVERSMELWKEMVARDPQGPDVLPAGPKWTCSPRTEL